MHQMLSAADDFLAGSFSRQPLSGRHFRHRRQSRHDAAASYFTAPLISPLEASQAATAFARLAAEPFSPARAIFIFADCAF